jgi:hypothetical protein
MGQHSEGQIQHLTLVAACATDKRRGDGAPRRCVFA